VRRKVSMELTKSTRRLSTKMPAAQTCDGRLTVVIPTYNHGRFIGQALESVFAQSWPADRVIVLDDASTDNTAEVVRPYHGRTLPFEYVSMAENRGVIAMLNCGVDMADTEYVTFLAADDFLAPEAFKKSLDILTRNPQAALCGMFARLIDEDGRPLRRPRDPNFGTQTRYVPPEECLARLYRDGALFGGNGTVYRTWHLQDNGGFSPDLRSFCDGFRIQELSLRHGACIVPEALAAWRQLRTSYAVAGRVDPLASLAILDAVRERIHDPAAAFPRQYRKRLERRLRFSAAMAALAQQHPDPVAVRTATGATGRIFVRLLVGLRRAGLCRAAQALLALYLRPFDIFPGLLRRLRRAD
jgi:glycosyltransferase involved in cell wall biosynthesis